MGWNCWNCPKLRPGRNLPWCMTACNRHRRRIRLFRIAFGSVSADQAIGAEELRGILRDYSAQLRFDLDWTPLQSQPKPMVKSGTCWRCFAWKPYCPMAVSRNAACHRTGCISSHAPSAPSCMMRFGKRWMGARHGRTICARRMCNFRRWQRRLRQRGMATSESGSGTDASTLQITPIERAF